MKKRHPACLLATFPIAVAVTVGIAGCTPKIYVIDRQTVLEEEAAGHWPQFEKDLLQKTKAQGPTPFLKTPFNARREKLLNVLNGELASSAAE